LYRASVCGAFPFEVIAGSPHSRYGARVTLQHPTWEDGALGRAFGFANHPWGPPRWVGLRIGASGQLRTKAYHQLTRLDDRFPLPSDFPADLDPVMAALDGEATEVYLRKRLPCPFEQLARACLAGLGAEPPLAEPLPRPRASGLCVSLRREAGRTSAVTLYADWRTLPRDQEIERVWSAGLGEADRLAYQLAVAGVRSTGFLPRGNWHAMLAWTVEADGTRHRAVSLTVPPPPRS
jgi:hypothetical protein